MSLPNKSERRIITTLADTALERTVTLVVRWFQRSKDALLSGDDSGLTNTWDEICVQVQAQESIYWDTYNDTARLFIAQALDRLAVIEREALWLKTEKGSDWTIDHEDSDPVPYDSDDVVEYVLDELHNRAANWSNPRIRTFLEHSDPSDF